MQLSEKEVELFMYDDLVHNHGLELRKRGLSTSYAYFHEQGHCHNCKWLRQVDMGAYGKLDIVGYYRKNGFIHVELFELKSVPIESGDFDQIFRYKKGIQQYFEDRVSIYFHLYLVGTGLNTGHYIHNNVNMIVSEYSYDLKGLKFESHTGEWYKTGSEEFDYLKALRSAEIINGYSRNRKGSAKIAQPDLEQSQIEKQ